jgi:hypothetical protein
MRSIGYRLMRFYYHVGLPVHDVLMAEGLTVEWYLDAGGRLNFDKGAPLRLFSDFAGHPNTRVARWEANACSRLVVSGPELAEVR